MTPPIVPADVDLRDFAFMPLEVSRLRRSKAWLRAKKRPEIGFYMMNLWTAAWHEKPAASLEDDDEMLCELAMCSEKRWPQVKADVMQGWVKCSDGRWYHPVVAEKARDSWAAKVAQRARTKAATEAREARRRMQQGERDEQRNVTRNVERNDQRNDERDVHQGTGTGIGIVKGEGEGEGYKTPSSKSGGGFSTSLAVVSPDAAAVAGWLRDREQGRGKPYRETAMTAQVISLADMTPTGEELEACYAQAVAERIAKNDPSPVNAGFLMSILSRRRGLAVSMTIQPIDPPMSATKRAILELEKMKEQYR